MKNKLFLSILAAFGLAASPSAKATVFVDVATIGESFIEVIDGALTPVKATKFKKDFRMTRDKVYILSQNTIIPSGVTLVIEPGTLIRSEFPTETSISAATPANPGALIVARGGTLIANGTADAPIIFTSMDDPHVPGGLETIPLFENKGVTNKQVKYRSGSYVVRGITAPGSTDEEAKGEYEVSGGTITPVRDYTKTGTGQGIFKHAGLWGGIVFAGRANITGQNYDAGENARATTAVYTGGSSTPGEDTDNEGFYAIEGMAAFKTSGFSYGGGDTDSDDQGVLRFVSNRYGGFEIQKDRELNAYSMYGVGYNTVIEFIEAFSNKDDDFEFWGGCNTVKYAICAFSGDDTFDTDAGWVGVTQFLITIANPLDGPAGTAVTGRDPKDVGDSLTENDGPEGVGAVPRTIYTLANATLIGRGYGSAATTSGAGTPFEHKGPNFKEGGAAKWYNNLIVDAPYGGIIINGTEANNWWGNVPVAAANVANGGRDGSGKKIDGTPDTITPSEYPGIIRGSAWFRCGLYNGKYTNLSALEADLSNTNYHVVTRTQLLPTSIASDQRGKGGTSSAANNTPGAVNQIFGPDEFSPSGATTVATFSNIVNIDPGFTLSHKTRIDTTKPMNLTPTNSDIKNGGVTLPDSSVAPQLGDLTPCQFIGAVRDNAWYMGWTFVADSGVLTGTLQKPVIQKVSVVNNKFVLTLSGLNNGVQYSVERSSDNKKYESIAILTASGATSSYEDVEIAVSDATPAYFYRVIGL
jgi:hypothetical protein